MERPHTVHAGLCVEATVVVMAVGPQLPYTHSATFVCGHLNVHGVAFGRVDSSPPKECAECGEPSEHFPAREMRQYRVAECQLVAGSSSECLGLPTRLDLVVTADSPFEMTMLGATCDIVGFVQRNALASTFLRVSCTHIANARAVQCGASPMVHDADDDYAEEAELFERSNAAIASLTGHPEIHRSLAMYLLVSLCSISTDPQTHAVTLCVAGDDAVVNGIVAAAAQCRSGAVLVYESRNNLGPVRRRDGVVEAGSILHTNGGILRVRVGLPRMSLLISKECGSERQGESAKLNIDLSSLDHMF
jgi:hypothetical protein